MLILAPGEKKGSRPFNCNPDGAAIAADIESQQMFSLPVPLALNTICIRNVLCQKTQNDICIP